MNVKIKTDEKWTLCFVLPLKNIYGNKCSKDVVAGSPQRKKKKKVFIINRKCVLWALLEGLNAKTKERVKKKSAKVSLGTG